MHNVYQIDFYSFLQILKISEDLSRINSDTCYKKIQLILV